LNNSIQTLKNKKEMERVDQLQLVLARHETVALLDMYESTAA